MAINQVEREVASSVLIAATYSAAGGTLPTLCRLAPIGLEGDVDGLLKLGYLVALLIYALVGFVVCLGFRERKYRQAFILGIAAPGLISNILAGTKNTDQQGFSVSPSVSFFASAHAATRDGGESNEFWLDLKRGLGFSVPIHSQRTVNNTISVAGQSPEPTHIPETSGSAGMSLEGLQGGIDPSDHLIVSPVSSRSLSDYPAFGGVYEGVPVDIWVRDSYRRFKYYDDEDAESKTMSLHGQSLAYLFKRVPPESICEFDQAKSFRDDALFTFGLQLDYYPPSAVVPVLDVVAVAQESGFRARLASSLDQLGVTDVTDSKSCEKTSSLYADTADELYHMAIDRTYP